MTERYLLAFVVLTLSACTLTPSTPPEPVTPGSDRYSQDQDAAPEKTIDVFSIEEPEPRQEPRSRYGNHSPYTVFGVTYEVLPSAENYQAEGIASWYGSKFHGHRTSSGEAYDMYQFTAAHRYLPLPTYARVTNLDNNESLIVRINDRGPFHPDREIDLSWAAAERLGIARAGTGRVRVETLTGNNTNHAPEESPAGADADAPGPRNPPAAVGLYLQVGAFGQPESAHALADRLLANTDQTVAIRPGQSGEHRVYRVWVGPFNSETSREAASRELADGGFGQSMRVTP